MSDRIITIVIRVVNSDKNKHTYIYGMSKDKKIVFLGRFFGEK